MHGEWRAPCSGDYLLLPGLRETSHTGTRIASILLPAPPDSFSIDAPAVEILNIEVTLDDIPVQLPDPVNIPGYSCRIDFADETLFLMETADVTLENENILESLLQRSGSGQRTVILR